jgi:hypothetical protein
VASHTRREGTAGGRTTQSNRTMSTAEKRTPIGAKNSAAIADGPGVVLEHVACERALVPWWIIAWLVGLPKRCDCLRVHTESQKTPWHVRSNRRLTSFGRTWECAWPGIDGVRCMVGNKKLRHSDRSFQQSNSHREKQ